ncbi:MAG: hypothetical protein JWN15_3595, partial [Firmicutes bacterium]|nr:hypothetical protein [Bacillota bacterium]
ALLVGLALVLLLVPALAIAADPPTLSIPLIPDRPAGERRFVGTPPLYEDEHFPPYAYTLEGDMTKNEIASTPIYFWMNTVLVTKAWLLEIALRVAEYAVAVDFLTPFLHQGAGALAALGAVLWDGSGPLVAAGLGLAGLWAIVLYMRGRAARVWASLGGSILVVMAATVVLTAGPDWALKANDLSRQITHDIYSAADGVGADPHGWGLIARSGDALWRTLVYEPWQAGEFGSADSVQKYGQTDPANSFLAKSVAERTATCTQHPAGENPCPLWAPDYMPQRMLLAGATFLATAVVAGSITVLAGGIILAQLALLFLLALAPVWLLVALWWPEQGQRLLSTLWMRALGALVMQSVLSATLGVLMLLSLTVTSVFTGWMLQSLLLAALGILAFRYRTAWLEPLAAFSRRTGEVSARVRTEAGRPEASRHTVTVAESQPAALPPAPAFATFSMPVGRAAPNPAAPEREELPGVAAAVQQVRVVSSAPAPHLAMFRSEMQLLREQITLAEHVTLREQMDQSGTGPGDATWRPLPAAAPDSAPVTLSRRATRQSAAGRERGSDLERIPKQRPRP